MQNGAGPPPPRLWARCVQAKLANPLAARSVVCAPLAFEPLGLLQRLAVHKRTKRSDA